MHPVVEPVGPPERDRHREGLRQGLRDREAARRDGRWKGQRAESRTSLNGLDQELWRDVQPAATRAATTVVGRLGSEARIDWVAFEGEDTDDRFVDVPQGSPVDEAL